MEAHSSGAATAVEAGGPSSLRHRRPAPPRPPRALWDGVGLLLWTALLGMGVFIPLDPIVAFGPAVVLAICQILTQRQRYHRLWRTSRQWQRAASGYETQLVKMRDRLQAVRSRD